MNILVVLHLKEWKHNGNCLRIKNIFGNLKQKHKVFALFLNKYDNTDVLHSLKPYFTKIYCLNYDPKEEKAGKIKKFITFNPYFVIKYSDKPLFDKIQNTIKDIIEKEQIDIIHTWHISNAQFAEGIGIPALYDICDSNAFTFKNEDLEINPSLINQLTFMKIKRYEKELIGKNHTVFVSDRDLKLLGVESDKAFIIPNGVDIEYFKPMKIEPERYSIVFSGDMGFRPNIQAVMHFYQNMFHQLKNKYPLVRWYIVGANPSEDVKKLDDGKNIVVTGFVDDIREYIAKASVVIAPMISGLGIKNKILEAMALGKPIVASPIAKSGIECIDNKDIIVANNPQQFVDKISLLFNDKELREKLSKNARDLILERYTWELNNKLYEKAYEMIKK